MNMVVQPHDLPCTFRVAARVRLLTQLQSFCAARNTFLSSAFSPSFFLKKNPLFYFNWRFTYFRVHPSNPILAPTMRGYIFFFWLVVRAVSVYAHFTTDLASVWPIKIISPSPYSHLRLLSFVHRPFLLFTRCPCSRGNVTMTNCLLPGRLLQVCTISNSQCTICFYFVI